MIDIDAALQMVLDRVQPKAPTKIAANDVLGLVLAEDVTSDIDSPPHDKAMVDGYALRFEDLVDGVAELKVIEEVTAGDVPTKSLESGAATRIMTGAPVPEGATAVVMVERTKVLSSEEGLDRVRVDDPVLRERQNIMPQGKSLRRGEVVLERNVCLRPIELALLAEVGRTSVDVHPRPSVAVLATGDELVPADQVPSEGKIRNSNGPLLIGMSRQAGADPYDLGIAADNHDALLSCVKRGLEHDVLLLSGGVSAGVLDLVPQVLADASVKEVFHKVHLKPGKPLWFGEHQKAERNCLVFGLPGNPVSSMVCFQLFVRPTLRKLAAVVDSHARPNHAYLFGDHIHRSDRPTYWPGLCRWEGERATVEALPWQGSADQRTLCQANCLIFFEAGERTYESGEKVVIERLDDSSV